MDYSAYEQTPDGIWVGTHRLPLDQAIMYCKMYRRQKMDCAVALVPDRTDPTPMIKLVEAGFR
jgi:hypothetical protein